MSEESTTSDLVELVREAVAAGSSRDLDTRMSEARAAAERLAEEKG